MLFGIVGQSCFHMTKRGALKRGVLYGTKYSKKDQVKFVEDSL